MIATTSGKVIVLVILMVCSNVVMAIAVCILYAWKKGLHVHLI